MQGDEEILPYFLFIKMDRNEQDFSIFRLTPQTAVKTFLTSQDEIPIFSSRYS